MEAHVIVHSVFCFTLLCVCVLHSLCVCLEGHSALLHTGAVDTLHRWSSLLWTHTGSMASAPRQGPGRGAV